MALDPSLRKELSELVSANPVVLFMKGTRRAPQCGFSAKVVNLLEDAGTDFVDVNVLASPELREGLKEFTNWPTIPQLYIAGKFVGGSDIVEELATTGELANLLGQSTSTPPLPRIEITPSAAAAFTAALAEGDEPLHLRIDASFTNDLFFGPPEPDEVEVSAGGLRLLLDRGSLRRAEGLSIDFLPGDGGGFKLDNPNAPPRVKQLGAPELKALLDRNAITLFDVRPESERQLASIAAARPLDDAGQQYLQSLDPNAPIALHCHHGVRSQRAAEQLLAAGFRNVHNLAGGIAAWSDKVDPSVPQY